uniref:F-box domain-containing protein n=1 Tax=Brassica oleracea var. oleracea TaxID=109376 RepID=A0A0D3D2V7_BRAOL
MNDKSEGKKEVIGSGLGRDWSELNREYLIDILSRLSLEERWSGPMLVCKPWMYACDDPSLNSVFDLYTWFEGSRISNLWYSYEFEQKVDVTTHLRSRKFWPIKAQINFRRRDRRRKRRKRRKSVHKEEKWENIGEVELPPEIAVATTARGHASLSPVFADQDEAVATDHAAIGVRTKPLEPPEVSPLCARALHAPSPEIASPAGPPPRHHRNAVAAAVLRLLLSPSSAVTAGKPSPSPSVTVAETFAFDATMGGGTETDCTSDASSICIYPYEEMRGAESSNSVVCGLASHTSLGNSPVAHPSFFPPFRKPGVTLDSFLRCVVDRSQGGLKEIRVRHCLDQSLLYAAERGWPGLPPGFFYTIYF